MSLTFGFYNSVDGDRVYDATQFASIFDGIINDGVFASVGHALTINAVTGGGMEVIARSGRCWFNSSWLYNDSDLDLTITAADLVYPRIDVVAVEINSTESVRKNDIVVLTGTPAATPVAPTLVSTDKVHQYALAEIAVAANVTEITAANITNKVGTTNTPFVTGILEVISIEDLLTQWTASFNDFMTDFETQKQTEFNTWFDHMKGQLSTDAAGHLQNEIDTLQNAIDGIDAYSKAQTDSLISGFKNITSSTINIPVATWDATNLNCTVTASGVTADNAVVVTPDPASMDVYSAAGIVCTAQVAGTITFTCKTVPTAAVAVNIMVVG